MTPNTPKCSFCGSPLIFVSEKIEKGEGMFPLTSTIYRCSDALCQKDIDKKTSDRIKLLKKRKKDANDRKLNSARHKIAS